MELELAGKIVFISGSSRGIGLATATGFLKEGAEVILNGRDRESLLDIQKSFSAKYPGRIMIASGDATTENGISEILSQIRSFTSKIDIFVANLGSGKPQSSDKLDVEEWKRFYDINVLSNISLLKGLYPLLECGQSPNVIFISSIVAKEKMSAPYGYAAAKSAVLTLTKNLAKDWADKGIRVNCVLPGNVFFKGGRWEELKEQDPEGVDKYIREQVPMGRFGAPEEIADAIMFLCSARAGFITGASLVVDGGQLSIF
ncbi:MAG: SDR family oxidoreductase [Lachnospiraceae bacterium]|nr:SDR family oxidoreductase [Lachnospiraceae bacterium]